TVSLHAALPISGGRRADLLPSSVALGTHDFAYAKAVCYSTLSLSVIMKNKGVFSICPTPFKPGGELDLQSLVSLVSFQLEAGIHGLAILGVMGELHKLSTFERRRVIETVVAAVRGAVPVWVGVRAMGTAAAVEQARSAEDLGADAIFVAPLAGADDDMQVSFYRQIVQAIRLSVVIHDFPELFAARISPALAVRLIGEA